MKFLQSLEVDPAILDPRDTYADASEWETKAKDLAARFNKNFVKYTGNEAGKAFSCCWCTAFNFQSLLSLNFDYIPASELYSFAGIFEF